MTLATSVPAGTFAGAGGAVTGPSWTGRTLLTFAAIAVALVLVGDKVPALAWWTLILVLLYLLLTNAPAAAAAIQALTNPAS